MKHAGGRPRKEPQQGAAARIEEAAANGADVRGIAYSVGINKDTLQRWFNDFPDLRAAYERGRERERAALHNALYRAATEQGNMIAAMFLLKARHGYREGDQGDSGNKVSITFSLPGALPMDQYREKVIEHGSDPDQRLPRARTAIARGA